MAQSTYDVAGMTCEHCERAVEKEALALPGVSSAQASAPEGRLTIVGDPLPPDESVRSAVEDAGYQLDLQS